MQEAGTLQGSKWNGDLYLGREKKITVCGEEVVDGVFLE